MRLGPDGVDRFVMVTASGEIEVRDAVSGTRLATRLVGSDPAPSWQRSQVVNDLLLVINGDTVTGYGLDRLDRRWTARLAQVAYLTDCGDLLCAHGQTGGMWALDPATGAVRWSNSRQQTVLRTERGRFLVGSEAPGGARVEVVAAATGRQLADLGRWELASWNEPGDRLIGVRRGRDGRLLVAELDVANARARVIGALPDVLGDCRTGRDVLVCRRVAGEFGVWWLP